MLPQVEEIYQSKELPPGDLSESIEILEGKNFFREDGGHYTRFVRLSLFGFENYLRAFDPTYQDTINDVAALIVKEPMLSDIDIAARLEIPRTIVMHILDVLAKSDLCTVSRSNMGHQVIEVSASLRRTVRNTTSANALLRP